MVGRKDPIKELAQFLALAPWSHDRLEIAIRAVCEAKKRPGNPSLALDTYAANGGTRGPEGGERVRVRVKVRKRRKR